MADSGVTALARLLLERAKSHRPWSLRLQPVDRVPTLEVGVPSGELFRLPVAWRAGRLGHLVVSDWIEGEGRGDGQRVLAAPAIGREVADRLRAAERSFLDGQGTVFLCLEGGRFVLDLRPGRSRPAGRSRGAGTVALRGRSSPAASRVLFVLLARPENLRRTVRELAAVSGTSIQSVSNALAALRDEGHLVRTARTGHAWAGDRPHALIDRFAEAWQVFLRASLVEVMLESSQTPEQREPAIAALLEGEGIGFGFGGTAGAERIQPWYRGPRTVVHLRGSWKPAWNRTLRVAPTSRDGSVIVLRTMGDEDLVEGSSHAHPLLQYAEMLAAADPHEREFADRLLPRVLKSFDTHVESTG